MDKISQSITRIDHTPKITGAAMYVADYPTAGVLFGKLLYSSKPRARLLDVIVPELPEGYLIVDKNDVPGENSVHIVLDDTPVFACETVEYIG